MLGFARNFLKREQGIATVELALVTPIFLMLFLSSIELGHMIYYSITIEKALRSAATFVGRHEPTADATKKAAIIATATNVAKTGTPNGTEFVVPGWADPDAKVVVEEKTFVVSYNGNTQDLNEVVYIVTVQVPYKPVVGVLVPALEYLMKTSIYNGKIMLQFTHEQALIGN